MPFSRSRLLLLLAIVNLGVIYALVQLPRGQVHVWVFPRGEGMVVVGPEGRALLIDGPASSPDLSRFAGKVFPPLGGGLDVAVVTRGEDDALWAAQAALFRRRPPDVGWFFPVHRTSAAWLAWRKAVPGEGRAVFSGDVHTGDGVRIIVEGVNPPVLRLTIGRLQVVYAPEAEWRQAIPAYGAEATVWVVGHLADFPPGRVLAPHVILTSATPADPAMAQVILAHPETTFYFLREGPFHLVTDGARYRLLDRGAH